MAEQIEITLEGLRSALCALSDILDEDEGPVILAWSVDRLAEALFVHLQPKLPVAVPVATETPQQQQENENG